jgi:hypothetical protein
MIPKAIEECPCNDIGAARPIATEAQFEKCVCASLELDQRSRLTSAEKNFAELAELWIEAYVENRHSIRFVSPIEVLLELLSANDRRQ